MITSTSITIVALFFIALIAIGMGFLVRWLNKIQRERNDAYWGRHPNEYRAYKEEQARLRARRDMRR